MFVLFFVKLFEFPRMNRCKMVFLNKEKGIFIIINICWMGPALLSPCKHAIDNLL